MFPHYFTGVSETVTVIVTVIGFHFEFLNSFAAEVKYALPERLVGGEGDGGTAGGYGEDGGGVENRVSGEFRQPENLLGAGSGLADGGERVEEVPERCSVGDGVVDGDSDENTVGEFGDLNGGEGVVVAGVGDGHVVSEKLLETRRDVEERRAEDGVDGEVLGLGVDEVSAGVVAEDVDVAGGVGGEAAGEGGEEREGGGEGMLERDDEVIKGVRWGSEEDTLLDVVT